MPKMWSELPAARFREVAADLATLAWVLFWGGTALELYRFLSGFRTVGDTIREGGANVTTAGVELSDALGRVPLVGGEVARLTRDAFSGAGQPFLEFGTELGRFVVVVAGTLAFLVALVTLVPWLARYLPWRAARLARVRAAHRAIRRAPDLPDAEIRRLLASRALHRLPYPELLEFTSDPFGDWSAGRHDRLAEAELASVGLRA